LNNKGDVDTFLPGQHAAVSQVLLNHLFSVLLAICSKRNKQRICAFLPTITLPLLWWQSPIQFLPKLF